MSDLEGPERLIGTRILDFELTSVLGSGGMSVVYRGKHRVTGQEVAVKILPPELATNDELKARFVEEARALALLEHPNIVGLNNFTESGGRLCLVMQFVGGETFENMIMRGPVTVEEVVRVAVEICKALEYAHARNVVHRDIKPSNILMRPDGAIKVTDFGIAKILGQSRLTSTGQTMGTVRYMSPEQVRGKQVDPRSDLYSLGIMMYEALTGQTPFDGDSQYEIMQKHLTDRILPLATFGLHVPNAVERLLFKVLKKNPDDRYSDAGSFREALEKAMGKELSVSAGPAVPRLRRTSLTSWIVLGLIIVGIGGGAAYLGPDKIRSWFEKPVERTFVQPHTLSGVDITLDRTFAEDGLRIQAVATVDAPALRDQYVKIVEAFRRYLATSDNETARAALTKEPPLTLTLVIVPQAILDRAELWPGFQMTANRTVPSRYVVSKRTLFVTDKEGFERRDLPYGVAFHILGGIRELPEADLRALAANFEEFYLSKAP